MSPRKENLIETSRVPWHALMAAHLAAFFTLGSFCIFCQRYLFADGSLFFLNMLRYRTVSEWIPARVFAHWLTQYPTVFLLRTLEVRDVKIAGLMFGTTVFLAPVAGLLIVWWSARKAPAHYLAFPMLSLAILYMNCSFRICSEAFQATWIFWCLLYLLMFSERLTVGRSIVLLAFGVLSTRTYETYVVLAWPLLFVAWRRGVAAKRLGHRNEFAVCAVCGLLFIASFVASLHSAIFPYDIYNRENFLRSFIEHLKYVPVQFSVVMIAGALWLSLAPHRWLGSVFWIIACVYGCVVAATPVFGFQQQWSFQYLSRVQFLYIPMLFGSLVALNPPVLRDFSSSAAKRQVSLWRVVAWTCMVSVLFQGAATLRWNAYRRDLVQVLSQRGAEIVYGASAWRPREFDWGFAMPSLSVTLSALNLGSISTIIPNDDPNGWQPFDPRNPSEIPDLGEYDVSRNLSERPH